MMATELQSSSQKTITERPTYRDYLRLNGIPLRHDLATPSGIQGFREASLGEYRNLYDALELRPEHRILEIGCHYGAFVYYLNQSGIIPDAVDLDEEKIKVLKQDSGLKANFMAGDAAQMLQGCQENYDYIFMNFVLEHIPPDKTVEFLRVIQQSLRLGGQLWVTVPNMENPFNLRLRYMEPTHCTGFTTESLIWFFYMGGFDHIECRDARKYEPEQLEKIREYFTEKAQLMGVRSFHNKFSETLICHGRKQFTLEDLTFGPYDF